MISNASAKGIDVARIRPDSERVMDEDMAICALVQRNLESGIYPGGSFSASKEVGTIYFQRPAPRPAGSLPF
jgi:hypothetical protein